MKPLISLVTLLAALLFAPPANAGSVVASLDLPVLWFEAQRALSQAADGAPIVLDSSIGAGPFLSGPTPGDLWIAVRSEPSVGGLISLSIHAIGESPVTLRTTIVEATAGPTLLVVFNAVLTSAGRPSAMNPTPESAAESAITGAPTVRSSASVAVANTASSETLIDPRTGAPVAILTRPAIAGEVPEAGGQAALIDARTGAQIGVFTSGNTMAPGLPERTRAQVGVFTSGNTRAALLPERADGVSLYEPPRELRPSNSHGHTLTGVRLIGGVLWTGDNQDHAYSRDNRPDVEMLSEPLQSTNGVVGVGLFRQLAASRHFSLQVGLEYQALRRDQGLRINNRSFSQARTIAVHWEHDIVAPLLPTFTARPHGPIQPTFSLGLAPGFIAAQSWRGEQVDVSERVRLDFMTEFGAEIDQGGRGATMVAVRVSKSIGQEWDSISDTNLTLNVGYAIRSGR
ncbi:MAG: hypothetical protein ACJAYU_002411 [Bradymonadia bacterium]